MGAETWPIKAGKMGAVIGPIKAAVLKKWALKDSPLKRPKIKMGAQRRPIKAEVLKTLTINKGEA